MISKFQLALTALTGPDISSVYGDDWEPMTSSCARMESIEDTLVNLMKGEHRHRLEWNDFVMGLPDEIKKRIKYQNYKKQRELEAKYNDLKKSAPIVEQGVAIQEETKSTATDKRTVAALEETKHVPIVNPPVAPPISTDHVIFFARGTKDVIILTGLQTWDDCLEFLAKHPWHFISTNTLYLIWVALKSFQKQFQKDKAITAIMMNLADIGKQNRPNFDPKKFEEGPVSAVIKMAKEHLQNCQTWNDCLEVMKANPRVFIPIDALKKDWKNEKKIESLLKPKFLVSNYGAKGRKITFKDEIAADIKIPDTESRKQIPSRKGILKVPSIVNAENAQNVERLKMLGSINAQRPLVSVQSTNMPSDSDTWQNSFGSYRPFYFL